MAAKTAGIDMNEYIKPLSPYVYKLNTTRCDVIGYWIFSVRGKDDW